MTTTRQQAAWLLCLLIGAWLGIRAGGSSSGDETKNFSPAESAAHDTSTSQNPTASTPATKSSSATPSTILSSKPEKPVKKTTLEDLRRLLALDPYECDLRRLLRDFENFAKGLPASDLPAAAAMLWGSPHRMWTIMTLMQVTNRWAETAPQAALDWVRTLKSDDRLVQLMRQGLLQEIGRDHPDLLWQEIGPTQEWMSEQWLAGGMVAQGFATDLKLAQKFLDAITDPSVHYFALSAIVGELGRKDPAAALAWIRTQPPSERRDQMIANLQGRLAEKNPDAALAMLNDSRSPVSAREREQMIQRLAEFHPDRMRDFISAGGLKSATMREAGLIGSYSKTTAAALLDLAPDVPAGEVRDSFLSSVSFQMSQQGDLDGAWKALQDIHPSLERITAVQNYGKGRARKSIADTTTWLATLPTGADRDAAITGFAQSAVEKQPQMALEWAAAVADPVYRQSALEDTFQTWHRTNAKAADAWLNAASTMSADEKARLMEKVAER